MEWLRFEPDSPVTGPVRDQPHVAYRVKSIAEASRGLKVLLEPFDVGFAATVNGFVRAAAVGLPARSAAVMLKVYVAGVALLTTANPRW